MSTSSQVTNESTGMPDAKTLALTNILLEVVPLQPAADERDDAMVDGILEGC